MKYRLLSMIKSNTIIQRIRLLIASVIFFALFTMVYSSPALAINNPDVMVINHVWVYQNCIEDTDQLYIVDYTIEYSSNPTELADEAYYIKLMNGSTELDVTQPYVYYDDGYCRGVASFYFTADEAPTWEGSYTVQLVGNPFLSWSGDLPITSISNFDVWQDYDISVTQDLVATRVIWLAGEFNKIWGASFDLFTVYAEGVFLSSYGVDYFSQTIPNLNLIAPDSFSGVTISPDIMEKEYSQEYADTLADAHDTTPLDMTNLGAKFSIDKGLTVTLFYYGAVFLILVTIDKRMESNKPTLIMSIPAVVGGPFIGVPMVITGVIGFLCAVLIGYVFFFQPASA